MKVLIIGGLASSLVHFRGPLIRAMLDKGHSVVAAANGRDPSTEAKLAEMGVNYHPIRLARAGLNPLVDVITVYDLCRMIRRVRPDVVLAYTIKPIVWGGCAARLVSRAKVFSMIEGMGYAYMPAEGLKHRIAAIVARVLYRAILPGSTGVFFLNPDDLRELRQDKCTTEHKAHLLDGIGVDNEFYGFHEVCSVQGRCRFLMVARLIKDKGVREFVDAARAIGSRFGGKRCSLQFQVAGELDSNPSSISQAEVSRWRTDGVVDYLGQLSDVRPAYRDSSVFVLPSYYREGIPRTILEAMAIGRPIITTDAPGCRETVLLAEEDAIGKQAVDVPPSRGVLVRQAMHEWARTRGLKIGVNGILVPPRNVEALVAAIQFFLDNPEQIAIMGRASRRYAEDRYDVHKVNAAMLEAMGL